jgi:antitoxin (DNA-binding transcriptional repressor) of toxin-antitoxin stability system
MTTKFIGIKDFRQNISDYIQRAQNSDTRFIVMNRNKPLFEIKPFAEDEYLDSFVASVLKAEAEVQAGKFHTEKEVMKELGIA